MTRRQHFGITPALALVLALFLATAAGATEQFIAPGSVWKYLDDGADQGTAWQAPAFVDAGWASGPAQLGYGDGDEATVVSFGPSASDKYITTYFRTTFDVVDPAQYLNTLIKLVRDDGIIVYLNGIEVVRGNMPPGTVGYLTLASGTISGASEDIFLTFSADPALLVTGTNTLAVEIHQRSSDSSDISFDMEVIGTTTPVMLRRAFVQTATPTSMRVVWKTDIDTDGRVWYGSGPDGLFNFVDDGLVNEKHDILVSGLVPNTRYYYAVGPTAGPIDGADTEHYFVTPPNPATIQPFRVWILGDSGTANADAEAVRDAYQSFTGATHTDLLLMLGDNAYEAGAAAEYQAAVFDMYTTMLHSTPVWPTRGNHDSTGNLYTTTFSLPTDGSAGGLASGTELYYSFDHANAHFVCLDSHSSDRAVGGPMWSWAEADLAATNQDWSVVFWHHAPYSKGSHDSDTETTLIEMRENFLPMLEAAGVDLVYCGHSHSYERSYFIDGHYGLSSTFTDAMKVDDGDGREDGTGAYNKAAGANTGTVYTTAGCSGKTSAGPLDHPVMFHSEETLGSVVLDFHGGRVDAKFITGAGQVNDYFTLLNDSYTGTYCVGGENSDGCVASIEAFGTPSATDGNPYAITAVDVRAGQFGLLFYGFGPSAAPFLATRLCVIPPIVRTAVQNSSGALACGGTFAFDFNAHIQSGQNPVLVPGATVYAQYWYRDPMSPFFSVLSNALQFVIQP